MFIIDYLKQFKWSYIFLFILFYLYIYPTTPSTSMYSTLIFDKQNDVVEQKIYPSFRKSFVCKTSDIKNVIITLDSEAYGRGKETIGVFDIILNDNSYINIKPNITLNYEEDIIINEFLKNTKLNIYTAKIVSIRNIFWFFAFLFGIIWYIKKTK